MPEPGLYLVATPIGHARDITLRALDLLAAADLIAAEDTRVVANLLQIHGLSARRTIPYHDHNGAAQRPKILAALAAGQVVALVSDAGTPLVSDPGYKLVQAALAEGYAVTALPGASAVLTGLQLSALPTDRFTFAGFLDQKPTARRRQLADLAAVPTTVIFFESANRLADSLADMAAVLGDRPAAVARELTKKFEEVRRAPLNQLAEHYRVEGPPRGEVVVIVGAPDPSLAPAIDLDRALTDALERLTVRDAADQVAAATGMPRRQVYARALELQRGRDGEA